MSYRIKISEYALKELEALPKKVSQAISFELDKLSYTPKPIGCKKIMGRQESFWRIMIKEYRVLYTIGDAIKIFEIKKPDDRKKVSE